LDNVSHTVAGLLLAEAVVQIRARRGTKPSTWFGRVAYALSAFTNNLPDFDFVYTRITQPPRLGYLLHHRGHTHTIPIALALAALALLATWLLARRYELGLDRRDFRWLAALAFGGALVHIAMDFTNNYGVHPFWPLDSTWLYGDFIFIVEPLFIAIGVPALLHTLRSRVARVLLGLFLIVLVGLAWLVPFVPMLSAALISLLAVASFTLSSRLAPLPRIGAVFGLALSVTALFFWAHQRALRLARASLPEGAALADVVLTPSPGNPLCFTLWRVSSTRTEYIAERGVVAPFPGHHPVQSCRTEPDEDAPTAPLVRLGKDEGRGLRWTGRFSAPLAELSKLARDDCFAAAFLRWSRVPFWSHGADETLIGDLRYDRQRPLEFAELVLPSGERCPRFVPSWTPPREDLLERARSSP
jgi:inner membrane protein